MSSILVKVRGVFCILSAKYLRNVLRDLFFQVQHVRVKEWEGQRSNQ